MKQSFEARIRGGFVLVAILLAVALGVMHFNFTQLNQAHALIKHTEEVKAHLQQLLLGLTQVQAGVRGYVISPDEGLLKSYEDATKRIPAEIAAIRDLTQDNPVQQQRLGVLEKQIAAYLESRARVVATVRTEGKQKAEGLAINAQTENAVGELRRGIQAMMAEEQTLLVVREHSSATKDWISRGTLGVVTVLVLAMLFSSASLIRLHLQERRQHEETVERARQFAEGIVESLREPLLVLTTDLRVRLANRAFCRVFEGELNQIQDHVIYQINRGQWEIPALRKLLDEELPKSSEIVDFELDHPFTRLGRRILLINIRRISAPGIEDGLVLMALEDITDRKEAEVRLQKLNQELQQRGSELSAINHELESFSYSVSHDLRAPIRHILGFSGLLKTEAETSLSAQGKRFLGNVQRAAQQMGTLVDELLAFSRMGRQEMQNTTVKTDDLVNGLLKQELLPDLQDRKIDWLIAKLPEVRGDPAMLRLVWTNLLSNAIKYTRKKPEARIEINAQTQNGSEIVFSVRDNGAGFDMSYEAKLFGVFQRLHRAEEFEGTGIGLASVRRIVGRHGGRTWAEGRVGEGACFYFSLPRNQE